MRVAGNGRGQSRAIRRVQQHLCAEGWRVTPVGRDLARWSLLAVHPARGARLIAVSAAAPSRTAMSELLAVSHPAGWRAEVWIPTDQTGGFRLLLLPSPPPLAFRGVDRCDACGAALAAGDTAAGLCQPCRQPHIEETPVRVRP
jgi:hypothetical protein